MLNDSPHSKPAANDPHLLFVLVHGGHSGAWVWDHVTPHLQLPFIAVDLPAHGNRPGDLHRLSFAECVNAIRSEIPASSCLILVGHSLGCAVVLALADQLGNQVKHLVLLAGPVPKPGVSVTSTFPGFIRSISKIVLWWSGPEFTMSNSMAEKRMLNGVPQHRIQQVCSRFTPESRFLVQEPLQWSGRPPAPCTYIQCLQDRGALSPSFQKQLAHRLGPDVRIVPMNTCHFAMLQAPEELARVLNNTVAFTRA